MFLCDIGFFKNAIKLTDNNKRFSHEIFLYEYSKK